MKLPTEIHRAGEGIGKYPDGALDVMALKLTRDGQVVVGIEGWLAELCAKGNEEALKLLSSLPALVQDTIHQHLKVQ